MQNSYLNLEPEPSSERRHPILAGLDDGCRDVEVAPVQSPVRLEHPVRRLPEGQPRQVEDVRERPEGPAERDPLGTALRRPRQLTEPVVQAVEDGVGGGVGDGADARHHDRGRAHEARLERGVERVAPEGAHRQRRQGVHLGVRDGAAGEPVRDGLGLVVVLEAGEVAPAGVAAQLDEPGADLDAEQEPANEQQDEPRRGGVGGAEEGDEDAGLEQQRLPPERIPDTADLDEGEVDHPQQQEGDHRQPPRAGLRDAEQQQDRHAHPDPRQRGHEPVIVAPPEHGGQACPDGAGEHLPRRRQPAVAEQRPPLRQDVHAREQVQRRDAALQQPARQPVPVGLEPVHVSP